MRLLGIILLLVGCFLAIGGIIFSQKPAANPLINILGAFALPLIFLTAGWFLLKQDKNVKVKKDVNNYDLPHSENLNGSPNLETNDKLPCPVNHKTTKNGDDNLSSSSNSLIFDQTLFSTEEELWELAQKEYDSKRVTDGLWTKCYVEANGDETKAKIIFLKIKFTQLLEKQKNLLEKIQASEIIERERKLAIDFESAGMGRPAICPSCGGDITTKTEACNHCNAWLGSNSDIKPIPKYSGSI